MTVTGGVTRYSLLSDGYGKNGSVYSHLLHGICVCVCVCVCVFIKLHITTQSGPVILVILCHSH